MPGIKPRAFCVLNSWSSPEPHTLPLRLQFSPFQPSPKAWLPSLQPCASLSHAPPPPSLGQVDCGNLSSVSWMDRQLNLVNHYSHYLFFSSCYNLLFPAFQHFLYKQLKFLCFSPKLKCVLASSDTSHELHFNILTLGSSFCLKYYNGGEQGKMLTFYT